MKEFEKWFLKGGAKINKYKIAESRAWRAALEWVLEECECDGWGDSLALDRNKIEEELKDERV